MNSVVTVCFFMSFLANAFSSEFLIIVNYSDVNDCTKPISGRVDLLNTCTPASGAYEIVTASLTEVTRTTYGDSLCQSEIYSRQTVIVKECSNGVKNSVSSSYALPYPVQHIGVRYEDYDCDRIV